MMTRLGFICIAVAGSLLASVPAHAQVVIHGTRQIFPGDQREITVRTENIGERSSLVQAWVDDGDSRTLPEDAKTPFVLRPPVYRLDAGESQSMRVLYTGADLPSDRESLYWLNVVDIPPAPTADEVDTGNYMQFSLRSRIKLIYRPTGLADAGTAPQKLEWSIVQTGAGWALQATNPTPYYVNMFIMNIRVQGKDHKADATPLIPPMSSATYTFKDLPPPTSGTVQFQYLNDYGAAIAQSVALFP